MYAQYTEIHRMYNVYMRVDLKVLALQYEGDDHLVPSMIPRESSAMDFAKVFFSSRKFFVHYVNHWSYRTSDIWDWVCGFHASGLADRGPVCSDRGP